MAALMEFSASLPLDLLAGVDPAARNGAAPLAPRPGETALPLPFAACLDLLGTASSTGELLPPTGKLLPIGDDDDAVPMPATEETAVATLAFAFAAPLPIPSPPPVSAPVGESGAAAANAAHASALPGAAIPGDTSSASSATNSAVTMAAASAAAADVDAGASMASAAAEGAGFRTEMSGQSSTAAAATAADDAAAAASTMTDPETYAAATSVATRAEPGPNPRRGEEPSRATPRAAQSAATQGAPGATAAAAAGGADNSAIVASTGEPNAAQPAHAAWHAASTSHATTSQTAAGAASTAAAPDQGPVDTTTPRWQEAFASRVQWLAEQKIGEAHLRLNPPELGTVDVKISLADDRTYVQLTTHTTAARDELAQNLPRLRELFTASGLELGGASVQSGRDGQARYEGGSSSDPHAPADRFLTTGDQVSGAAARRPAAPLGRIDLFA